MAKAKFEIVIAANGKQSIDELKRVQKAVNQLKREGDRDAKALKKSFSGMGGLLAGAGVAYGIVNMGKAAIMASANIETMRTSFAVFLKDGAKANAFVKELQAFAAKTPLQLNDISNTAQMLIASAGVAHNEVTGVLKTLGDLAQGDSERMGRIAVNYTQIRSIGRASTMDIRQFANAGIPIFAELAKVTGKSGVELQKLIEAGKVGPPEIEKAFKNLTTGGGLFEGLMEKQANTLKGALSTMKDNISLAAASIGDAFAPAARKAADAVTAMSSAIANMSPDLTSSFAIGGIAGIGMIAMLANIKNITAALGFLGAMLKSTTGLYGALAGVATAGISLAIKSAASSKEMRSAIDKLNKGMEWYTLNAKEIAAAEADSLKHKNNLIKYQKQQLELEEKIAALRDGEKSTAGAERQLANLKKRIDEAQRTLAWYDTRRGINEVAAPPGVKVADVGAGGGVVGAGGGKNLQAEFEAELRRINALKAAGYYTEIQALQQITGLRQGLVDALSKEGNFDKTRIEQLQKELRLTEALTAFEAAEKRGGGSEYQQKRAAVREQVDALRGSGKSASDVSSFGRQSMMQINAQELSKNLTYVQSTFGAISGLAQEGLALWNMEDQKAIRAIEQRLELEKQAHEERMRMLELERTAMDERHAAELDAFALEAENKIQTYQALGMSRAQAEEAVAVELRAIRERIAAAEKADNEKKAAEINAMKNRELAAERDKQAKEMEMKKRAFEWEKANKIAQVVMSSAQAAIGVYAGMAPAIGLSAGLMAPLAAGLVAGILALAAAQIALIASQSFQGLAEGGIVPAQGKMGGLYRLGDENRAEAVIPLERMDEFGGKKEGSSIIYNIYVSLPGYEGDEEDALKTGRLIGAGLQSELLTGVTA